MARSQGTKSVDIPRYLYDVLDQVAAYRNTPTNRLIATWLWEELRRRSDDPDYPGAIMRDIHEPYDTRRGVVRDYPRKLSEPAHE